MTSVGSEMTRAESFGVVGEEIGEYSIFWCFWTKLAILDRVSRANMVVECDCLSVVVKEDVCEEKMEKFDEFSLVG